MINKILAIFFLKSKATAPKKPPKTAIAKTAVTQEGDEVIIANCSSVYMALKLSVI